MTDEELNRKFDVVAEHLATVAVNQQKSDARIDHLERVLSLAIRSYRRERKETREKFDALIDAQTRTDEALAKLAESQVHIDKRLDTLIDIVRDNRNGSSNV
ncbi:MAG: hypothetical protein QOC96_1141 [Acidobacteriota bacterium]|jgi:hypothetical protein|nr:hypothetical protein [Acidobacteriota bacterium]